MIAGEVLRVVILDLKSELDFADVNSANAGSRRN